MADIHSRIRPNTHLFLRLPSEILKLVEIHPNTIIEIGKFGSFSSNLLLGRPYYCTYEVLEKGDGQAHSRLRIVPPGELNAEQALAEAAAPSTPSESRDETATTPVTNGLPDGHDLLGGDGAAVILKNNRLTVDDASRQALTQEEIEELKRSSGGKEIIEKILANHAGLEEKTEYSKAKYTLRKTKKYLKRFTALPMDIGTLTEYIIAKDPPRILDLRQEVLGLIAAWSNVHYSPEAGAYGSAAERKVGGGRWLVVDESGGLVVAAMAEKMGILYPEVTKQSDKSSADPSVNPAEDDIGGAEDATTAKPAKSATSNVTKHDDFAIPAATNTITLLHPAIQPNLSLLKYFGYDTNNPDPSHPLQTHLKTLSWLQLLHPEEDTTYREPEHIAPAELHSWKSGKRGAYWKKRRRWDRCKAIVDETRAGGFDGLVVASNMDPESILLHTVPLVRGGGHVVVYSATAEPLVRLVDLYSRDRRAAYIQCLARGETVDGEDFPVDPRLLLAPTLQTSRVREWQVLPGRTHPLMSSRGGAEGYVFTASRVLPLEGSVIARGNFTGKRRKVGKDTESSLQ